MAFWNTTGGTALIVFLVLAGLGIISLVISYAFPDTNIFEKAYEFFQYIYSMIGSNFAVFGIFIYLIAISFFLKSKPKMDSPIFYILLLVVPLLASGFYLFSEKIFGSVTNLLTSLRDNFSMKTILYILLAIVGLYGFYEVSKSAIAIKTLEYGSIIIAILMGIVALAIAFRTNRAAIYNMKGLGGFIVNLILFIPCLLSDFVEYLYGDFATTPKIVYLLFLIELILILLYLYIPKIIKRMEEKRGKTIIDKPIRINFENNVTNYIDMQSEKPQPNVQSLMPDREISIRSRFALSLWIYVVPMPPNHIPYNKPANILDFNNHPAILYNGTEKKFTIHYNNVDSDVFDVPLEKWNQLIVNYDKETVDLFLNGVLIKTRIRRAVSESFNIGDILTTGQENGLQGGIAKVVYYERPLLSHEINSSFQYEKKMVGTE
uniref:Uncharacterized protein n=1 Tax=viral metagenome TaxID=1070528 RepID=A0A6C0B7E5_9ZZZZ